MLRVIAKLIDSKLDDYCVSIHQTHFQWHFQKAYRYWTSDLSKVIFVVRHDFITASMGRFDAEPTLLVSDLALTLKEQRLVVIKDRYHSEKSAIHLADPEFMDRLDELLEPFRIISCSS